MVCYKISYRLKFLPNKINLRSKFITSTDSIVQNFNKYFAEIGSNLANKISTIQPEYALGINKLSNAFYSLKTNKSPGYDGICSNIVKQCLGTLNRPLHYTYNISLQIHVFPENC